MSSHKNKSGGKPRQRGQKGDQRRQIPEQSPSPKFEQDAGQTDLMVASSDPMTASTPTASMETASTEALTTREAAPVDVPLVGEVLPPAASSTGAASAGNYPVTIQTIAKAYGKYTTRSFEDGMSFVEKLMSVRSFDKVIEVHTEFARQAYANFFAESGRMCELYSELAKQTFRPWERFSAQTTQARRQIW
jgi:Phasin protein